ncbi:unnamed protein product [Cercospora beticola]|nr:unnamed protein product [Cercospora beticola]
MGDESIVRSNSMAPPIKISQISDALQPRDARAGGAFSPCRRSRGYNNKTLLLLSGSRMLSSVVELPVATLLLARASQNCVAWPFMGRSDQ